MRTIMAIVGLPIILGLALTACAREQEGIATNQPLPAAPDSTTTSAGPGVASDSGYAAATPPDAAPGAYAILPGEGIGHIRLGENLESVAAELGRPDSGDAAMGHVWAFWLSKTTDDQLGVYATFDSNATGHFVREIRVTSPAFHLPSGLSSGDSFAEARRQFEHTIPVAEYTPEDAGQGTVTIFDAVDSGVAFEVASGTNGNAASGKIIAILVHHQGRKVTQEYMPYRDFRRLDEPGSGAP